MVKDWEKVQMGECFDFKNGLNKGKDYFGTGTPIINYMDVYKKRGMHKEDIKGRVTLSSEEISRFKVEKNDVFFTRTSETPEEVGFASVLLDDIENCVFSGFVLRARPKNQKLYPAFCQYCFMTNDIRQAIEKSCTYTTRALTNGKVLSMIEIALPPYDEQLKISEAISDIDELISSLEKLIAKKKAIKQGTMQQLLTGKTRLPGFTSPWEKKKIDDLGRFVSGNGFPLEYQGQQQGKYPFYKVSDFNSPGNERFLHRANNYISDEIVNTLNCNIIPEKSIVFAKIGAAIFLERKKFTTAKCCIDNNTMSFQPDNSYSALYIWYLFQTICLGDLVEATALPSLSGRTIGSVQRDIPSTKNEQDYIANVLLEIDIDIESIEKKLAKTRQLKQGMMQQLLTGKTRIGGDKR